MPPVNLGQYGVPSVARSLPIVRGFGYAQGDDPIYEYAYYINGTTRDAAGTPLANCTVKLYRTADDSVAAVVISDGSGKFSIASSPALNHYLVAYLPGSPDVAGTTINTLVGAIQ